MNWLTALLVCIAISNTTQPASAASKKSHRPHRQIASSETNSNLQNPKIVSYSHFPLTPGIAAYARYAGSSTLGEPHAFSASVQSLFQFIGFDLSYTTMNSSFGAIFPAPGASDRSNASQDGPPFDNLASELLRNRSPGDSWKLSWIEPGVMIRTRLFFLPQWSRISSVLRFGLGRTLQAKDEKNGLDFAGWLPSVGGGLQFSFLQKERLHVELGLQYHWGALYRKGEEGDNSARIPIQFLNLTAGIGYRMLDF